MPSEVGALQPSWRGYVESFPFPARIPLFRALSISVDTPARLNGFVAVMDRAGPAPPASDTNLPLDQQAALVTQSIRQYSGRLADDLALISPMAKRKHLDRFRRRLEELSSVAELVPQETLHLLEQEHRDIEIMISGQESERAEQMVARLKRVRNFWGNREDVSVPAAALDAMQDYLDLMRMPNKYRGAQTEEGIELRFTDPAGVVAVAVKTPRDALLLTRAFEASGERSVLDLKMPTPDVRHVRFDADNPISFGLEIEYPLKEHPRIVEDYRLPSVSEKRWLALAPEKRIELALAASGEHGQALLKRLSSAPKEMPAVLVSEVNDSVEMNGLVFESLSAADKFARAAAKLYGPGSHQGHVVFKKHDQMSGLAGYIVFEADAAQLKTLERGFARYLVDDEATPGKNLVHPYLGPLNEDSRLFFLDAERKAVKGAELGPREPDSHNVNAPVLRDDIYPPGFIGLEFRQYHKRYAALSTAMDDFSAHLTNPGDMSPFKSFGKVRQIERDLPFERSQELGMKLDKRQWKRFFQALGDEVWVRGTPIGQRFFYPLKDWRNNPVVRGLEPPLRREVRARIDQAQREFIASVDFLVNSPAGARTNDAVLRDLRIAVARWAGEVRLSEYFEAFRSRTLAAAGSRGPPSLDRLPFVSSVKVIQKDVLVLDGVPPERKTFPDGRAYLRYDMRSGKKPYPDDYARFMDSTIEAIYREEKPFGHIDLRVGRRLYSFNHVLSASANYFSMAEAAQGSVGFVFRADPQKIRAVRDELEKLHQNAVKHNLPPFDWYSPKMRIVRIADEVFSLSNFSRDLAHLRTKIEDILLSARLVEESGRAFLRTEDGFEYPVIKKRGKLYVQSLSCSTAATYVMRKHFGIDVEFDHGAKSLKEALGEGNPGRQAPDAIVDY